MIDEREDNDGNNESDETEKDNEVEVDGIIDEIDDNDGDNETVDEGLVWPAETGNKGPKKRRKKNIPG